MSTASDRLLDELSEHPDNLSPELADRFGLTAE